LNMHFLGCDKIYSPVPHFLGKSKR